MNKIEELRIKKENLEELLGRDRIKGLKPMKFLKLVSDDILELYEYYHLTEVLEIINELYSRDIKYNTFYKFHRTYCTNCGNSRSIQKSVSNIKTHSKTSNNSLINLPNINANKYELKDVDTSRYKK